MHDERSSDTDRDRVGERHQDDSEQRREALLEICEVDLLEEAHHQEPDQDQSRRRGRARHQQRERRQEDGNQEQHARGDGRQPGTASFRNACRALDVGGVRTDSCQTSNRGTDRVDEQQLADVFDLAVIVHELGLLDHRGGRTHGVEEVGQHEGEDRQDGDQYTEFAPHISEIEHPEGVEVDAGAEIVGYLDARLPDESDHRGGEDGVDDRTLHLSHVEHDHDEETDQRDRRAGSGREHELDRCPSTLPDQAGIHEPDEEDE